MSEEQTMALGRQLQDECERYVTLTTECVSLVSDLLDAYARGDGYRETAGTLRALESDCDASNRPVAPHIRAAWSAHRARARSRDR